MPATTIIDDEDDGPPRLAGGRFYMTPESHATLTTELHHLRATERPRIVDIVSWAAGNGDRSENGDYLYGKRRLREIDGRMRFLMRRLRHAEVIDPKLQSNRARVFFGASVTYVNERDEERKVTIVGVDEADMAVGKISIASPVALALLRAQVGDEVGVRTPRGVEMVEILAIAYPA
jgi:transcription elongation factor GreB